MDNLYVPSAEMPLPDTPSCVQGKKEIVPHSQSIPVSPIQNQFQGIIKILKIVVHQEHSSGIFP